MNEFPPIVNRFYNGMHENGLGTLSNGTSTQASYRTTYTVPAQVGRVLAIRARYINQRGELPGPNPITVKGSFLFGATIVPMVFGAAGSRTRTIQPFEVVYSNWHYISLTGGFVFSTLTNVSVANVGQQWVIGAPAVTNYNDAFAYDVDAADTNAGLSGGDAYAFAPCTIEGMVLDAVPVVGIVANSIGAGQVDDGANYQHEGGFLVRACNAAGVPHVRIALAGESAATFSDPLNRVGRMRFLQNVPTVIDEYGINDLNTDRTVAQIKASLQANWRALAQSGVKRIIRTTITPGTFVGTKETNRTELNNNYFRNGAARADCPIPMTVVDVAALVESLTTGGAVLLGGPNFALDYGSNGLHPSASGHTVLATGVPAPVLQSGKIASYTKLGASGKSQGIGIGF